MDEDGDNFVVTADAVHPNVKPSSRGGALQTSGRVTGCRITSGTAMIRPISTRWWQHHCARPVDGVPDGSDDGPRHLRASGIWRWIARAIRTGESLRWMGRAIGEERQHCEPISSGRSMIVTGGGTGIGAAWATWTAEEGNRITICGRPRGRLGVIAKCISSRRYTTRLHQSLHGRHVLFGRGTGCGGNQKRRGRTAQPLIERSCETLSDRLEAG